MYLALLLLLIFSVFPVAFIEYIVNALLSVAEWIVNSLVMVFNFILAVILNFPIALINWLLDRLYEVKLIGDALRWIVDKWLGTDHLPYVVNPIPPIDLPTFSMGMQRNYSPLAQTLAVIFPLPLEYAYILSIIFFAIVFFFIIRIKSAM